LGKPKKRKKGLEGEEVSKAPGREKARKTEEGGDRKGLLREKRGVPVR